MAQLTKSKDMWWKDYIYIYILYLYLFIFHFQAAIHCKIKTYRGSAADKGLVFWELGNFTSSFILNTWLSYSKIFDFEDSKIVIYVVSHVQGGGWPACCSLERTWGWRRDRRRDVGGRGGEDGAQHLRQALLVTIRLSTFLLKTSVDQWRDC